MSGEAVRSLIVMGVMGSGKSTIGSLLAARLGMSFIDGDDLHSESNRSKMAAGIPLTDADRGPWLTSVGNAILDRDSSGVHCVVACSALRRSYRDTLRAAAPGLVFVHLAGSREVLESRLRARTHEFMSQDLLQSQLDALEPLGVDEEHLVADITQTPETLIAEIAGTLVGLTASPAGNGKI